jgi:hypothetical protein
VRAATAAGRPALVSVAAAVLVAGPVALAFWSGGYFDGPRLVALAAVGALLALLAVSVPAAELVPASWPGRAAVGGLVLWAGWVGLSRGRSVLPDVAGDDAERILLYAGFLAAGAVAWRRRRTARAAEPAVAVGILLVVLYGLAGRWLPGIIELSATRSAGGRLEQPLTYWNAIGLLAAIGIVLCVRMAADEARGRDLRAGAAAAIVPLACGLYLSFSRGALAALAAGLIVLAVCAPSRGLLRSGAIALLSAGVAVAVSAALDGVRALEGTAEVRDREGLVALAVTLLCAGVAATLADRATRAERRRAGTATGTIRLPGAARWVAGLLVVLIVAVPVLAARGDGDDGTGAGSGPAFGASSRRFSSVDSNRYAYWRVAVDAFRAHPVDGLGSGGFKAEWLRERNIPEDTARDAHSLPLETLAELGLVGFALLLVTFGAVAACARTVQRQDPGLAAGLCAALTVWAVHAALDWDWEMPGATLPALTLAAVLVARSGPAAAMPAPTFVPASPGRPVAAE